MMRAGLLTVDDIMADLAVSRKVVYRLIARRELDAIKVGRSWRFELSAVERFKSGRRLARIAPMAPVTPRRTRHRPGCELALTGADYFSRPRHVRS